MALDALLNHHLLITICDAVLNHPAGCATSGRSRGWIFAAVEKHSSSSFELAFALFGTEKVEKVRAGFLQKLCRLSVTKLKIRERLLIPEWHDGERKSCRDRLDRPFRMNLGNRYSNDARDIYPGKWSSKFRVALAHFPEDLTVHSITSGVLRIRSETHGNFPDFQIESDFGRLLLIRL
jgi:hypothetical protein